MCSDRVALDGCNVSRVVGKIAAEELPERSFADKTDSGRVLLVEIRQAKLPRQFANVAFVCLTERNTQCVCGAVPLIQLKSVATRALDSNAG